MLTHVYLSAHLDDAVLSCGGMIHRQAQAGERVVVATLCAGDLPPGPLSEFAQSLHQRWGLGQGEVIASRRAEDLKALDALGAEAVHLHVPDCIYRTDPAGRHLYASERAIFGELHPAEYALARRLAEKISGLMRGVGRCHLYAPLGLGHHVDHQLTRRAVETVGNVYAYFEDYPYAAREAGSEFELLTRTPDGRISSPEVVPLAEGDLSAKTTAIAQYVSQISSFWANLAEMEASVRQYAERAGDGRPAERLWRLR
ncbi:MAG TPA: PIG-L family deacetylase [Anaerolineales bacterium]|nr:PIG-L family deacetylase [Anaerolineales bacterium]